MYHICSLVFYSKGLQGIFLFTISLLLLVVGLYHPFSISVFPVGSQGACPSIWVAVSYMPLYFWVLNHEKVWIRKKIVHRSFVFYTFNFGSLISDSGICCHHVACQWHSCFLIQVHPCHYTLNCHTLYKL